MCKNAGLPRHYTDHSLWSTAATKMYQHDLDEQLIMEITGHRSLAVRSYKLQVHIAEAKETGQQVYILLMNHHDHGTLGSPWLHASELPWWYWVIWTMTHLDYCWFLFIVKQCTIVHCWINWSLPLSVFVTNNSRRKTKGKPQAVVYAKIGAFPVSNFSRHKGMQAKNNSQTWHYNDYWIVSSADTLAEAKFRNKRRTMKYSRSKVSAGNLVRESHMWSMIDDTGKSFAQDFVTSKSFVLPKHRLLLSSRLFHQK